MKRLIGLAGLMLAAFISPASAQNGSATGGQAANQSALAGGLCQGSPAAMSNGQQAGLLIDCTTHALITEGGGGGGSTTVNQGTPNAGGTSAWPVSTDGTAGSSTTICSSASGTIGWLSCIEYVLTEIYAQTSITILPTKATGAYAPATVGTTDSTILAASTAAVFLDLVNNSPSATICINFGATATISGTTCAAGEVTLPPLWAKTYEADYVPTDAIHAIASAASTPASVGAK
jgi:hypothetical protein